MAEKKYTKLDRREFLKRSGWTTAAIVTGLNVKPAYAGRKRSGLAGKKVVVLGIDGMDPVLAENMMDAGKLPNFSKLRAEGGYRHLGSSIPPQSPVAWANFINGAGPGSHGIFDFIHRDPKRQAAPYLGMTEEVHGEGYWEVGEHHLQFDFWPFNHKMGGPVNKRMGTPFWDHLDEVGINSVFYNLPSNYPPSESKYGNHKCLSGMGTPDMEGNHGGNHLFSEDGPVRMKIDQGCKHSMLFFEDNEMAEGKLFGPPNTLLKEPEVMTIDFVVHRDVEADGAVIEIQGEKIVLKKGQWSKWIPIAFEMRMPWFLPDGDLNGICCFYLQEVSPNFRLYVSPINTNPSDPDQTITEPPEFIKDISKDLGLFYTTGMQEDFKALTKKIFTDDEFVVQAKRVLDERMRLLNYAMDHYDDGLLYFYFSSTDLQAHMLWWDSDEKHPTRTAQEAKKYYGVLKAIYQRMDEALGQVLSRFGDGTVIVMSDHGFANFKRQFNLNRWLRDEGYIGPEDAVSILGMSRPEWLETRAYGLGINGLYVNQVGREKYGVVGTGKEKEELVTELITKLEAVRDVDGKKVINKVFRTDEVYNGPEAKNAPDLIVGYARGYRASWVTILGDMNEEVLTDNTDAWCADHCADPSQLPGVLFSNKPIAAANPALIDVGPSILAEYGIATPAAMEGKSFYAT